jgi:hypothetical protein
MPFVLVDFRYASEYAFMKTLIICPVLSDNSLAVERPVD